MAQYYTLEEAARILGMSQDELRKMADRREVQPFRDRATIRFRSQQIDELARQRGLGSNASVPIADVPPLKPADSPAPAKQPPIDPTGQEMFAFDLAPKSEQVDIGREILGQAAGGSGSKKGAPSSRSKLGGQASPRPSPRPRPGSDSEVRLVADGSDLGFQIAGDTGSKKGDPAVAPATPKSGLKRPSRVASSESRLDTGASPTPRKASHLSHLDSGVRLVPPGEPAEPPPPPADDARKPGAVRSDTDVRLDEYIPPAPVDSKISKVDRPEEVQNLTDEIDLDAELKRAEQAAQAKAGQQKPKAPPPALPTASPFELSDVGHQDHGAEPGLVPDSSSDFELTPASEENRYSAPDLGSHEIPVMAADDEVSLHEPDSGEKSGDSGIRLQDPADSGISLEEEPAGGEDTDDFELSLDADTTPRPAPAAADDSDSEFELSLDAEGATPRPAAADDETDSSSEFELSVDESGGLAPIEEEQEASGEERDIFETDFEVPALDEESDSEAVALDSGDADLETSDFDLALDEQDVEPEDESQSQVVVLSEDEDEELDDSAARRRQTADEDYEEEEGERSAGAAAAAPARWGVVPVLLLMPCVVVMLLVALMGFEMVRGMWGYHHSQKLTGVLVDPISKLFPGGEE